MPERRGTEGRQEGSNPITIYINSRGGFISVLEVIDSALKCPSIGGEEIRTITVAIGDVASAAANLLTFGHYAISYPESTIVYHGIRVGEVQVTFESAQNVAAHLAEMNRKTARKMAQAILPRVMFRFLQVRKTNSKKRAISLSPQDGLVGFVRESLDPEIFRQLDNDGD